MRPYEFFAASLRDLIPVKHGVTRVARVLDLAWLRAVVADLYCPDAAGLALHPRRRSVSCWRGSSWASCMTAN